MKRTVWQVFALAIIMASGAYAQQNPQAAQAKTDEKPVAVFEVYADGRVAQATAAGQVIVQSEMVTEAVQNLAVAVGDEDENATIIEQVYIKAAKGQTNLPQANFGAGSRY